jgi:hypothetical protein
MHLRLDPLFIIQVLWQSWTVVAVCIVYLYKKKSKESNRNIPRAQDAHASRAPVVINF